MAENDIGYYTLPVILSFDGVEKQVTNKLTKAFGDVGKKGSKALAEATEADLKKAADAYGKLRDRAEDALGKVRVEEEKLAKARAGGKTEQIVAAEERLNKARRDSNRLTREAGAAYDDLSDKQRRLGSGTRDLGGNFSSLGDLAGSAGRALTAAGVVAAGAALAGITALGAGVVVVGTQLYELGRTWDDVTDRLAVRTARLGPDLDKLKTAVKDLAPATASSIGSIGDVVGQVSQALRLTGTDLTAVSKTILDLNRITGEDLNVRELGKAFRGFGVDAAAQVPTLDALYRASAATGIGVNELVAAVVAAGPAARTLGLDLDDTASLLATFNEAGVNGEAAVKGLSVAVKNLAKDGREPAAALRETLTEIEGLLAAGRDTDAVNIAAKIFGRGYGPILDAIRSGALDAQSLNKALADGAITIADVAQGTADWEERWQQLKNTLAVALEPLASGVFTQINSTLDRLADWITNNQSTVIGFFQQVVDWAFRSAEALIRFAAESLRAIGELIRNLGNAFGPLFDSLKTIGGVAKFIPGFQGIGQAMEDVGKAGQTIGEALDGIPGTLDRAAGALEGKVLPAIQQGRTYADAFIERTKQATRFTEVLGDTVARINDEGDIVLTDNTPEVTERLAELGITVTEMPDGTVKVEADTEEATKVLDAYRAQQEGKPIEVQVGADTTKAEQDLDNLFGKAFDVPVGAVPGGGPFIGGAAAGGMQKFAASSRTGSEKGLTANSIAVKRGVEATFPAIQSIGGYRPPDVTPFGTFTEHSSGQAVDVMVPNWSTPRGKAYGDQIAQWALANADTLGTEWVIWQQRTHYPDGRVSKMPDRGSPTQNHYDHVHIKTAAKTSPAGMQKFGPGRGGAPRTPTMGAAPMSAGTLSEPMSVPEPDYGTTAAMSGAINTAPLSPDLTNAYGPGFEPGIGTPGVNEYGEPGYYRTDPKRAREAEQRVLDADESIRQADAAVAQAEARQRELDYGADESATLAAAEGVRAAKARADKARRERIDAQADLDETLRGEFTRAQQATQSGGGGQTGGGMGQLGGLGSIFSSFLGDTFGIGDWLPALDNLMPLQAADTLLSAFMPLGMAAASGRPLEFGPQTPGWYPGMSGEEFGALKAGTSSAPFGIPDIAAPPMPTGGQHGGSGAAPGPATIVNVDQSQNFTNSPLGWDPAQVNKQRDRNIQRAPRLPVGMGSS